MATITIRNLSWELERPMPGWLYQAGKVVAG